MLDIAVIYVFVRIAAQKPGIWLGLVQRCQFDYSPRVERIQEPLLGMRAIFGHRRAFLNF